MAKRQNIRFKVSGGVVTLNKDGKNTDLLFEAVRREPGWEEKLVTKMQLYSEFYEYYNVRDSGFDNPPQLVILGEDDSHLVEIFKLIVKNHIDIHYMLYNIMQFILKFFKCSFHGTYFILTDLTACSFMNLYF